jgi:hypothetical protein
MFKFSVQSLALVQYLGFGMEQNCMCLGFFLIHTQSVVQDMGIPEFTLFQYRGKVNRKDGQSMLVDEVLKCGKVSEWPDRFIENIVVFVQTLDAC